MATYFPNKTYTRMVAQGAARPLVDKVLDETLAGARKMVPVRSPRRYDRRPTGRLKRSLKKVGPKVLLNAVKGSVGSRLPFAISVHEGAQAHVIEARNHANLKFFWAREGRVFVGRVVHHPGVVESSTTPYLYVPLLVAGARHNFIVRRTPSPGD
jgi:hypothetical protein